jgi:pilus assembly protein CpaF
MIAQAEFESALAELLAPIAGWLARPEVSEVLVNGAHTIYVERRGQLERVAARFDGETSLRAALRLIAQYVGRPFDEAHPILEGRLPDGSRVEAVLGVLAAGGSHLAIRRFNTRTSTLAELAGAGAITMEMAGFLERAVIDKRNVIVSGGTGSGKTSLLKLLGAAIPAEQRVVVLEDARELNLPHPHVVSLEARPADERGRGGVSIRHLLRATLRLRPDRIVLGEIRDGAALDLIQAMTSGHGGCLATLHASNPGDALARLETMAMFADTGLPLAAIRQQVASAVDIVVQLERLRDGRRVVACIAALDGLSGEAQFRWRLLYAHPDAPPWLAPGRQVDEPPTARMERS